MSGSSPRYFLGAVSRKTFLHETAGLEQSQMRANVVQAPYADNDIHRMEHLEGDEGRTEPSSAG